MLSHDLSRVAFGTSLALSLAGCAIGPSLATRLQAYVGQPESVLVQGLGVPNRTIATGGRKFVAYDWQSSTLIPGSPGFAGFGWGGFGGPGFGAPGFRRPRFRRLGRRMGGAPDRHHDRLRSHLRDDARRYRGGLHPARKRLRMTAADERAVAIRTVAAADVRPFIPALARLRITVFRDWPYLYDGDQTYEEGYLRIYAESPRAAVVLALDGAEVVGASTCLPLTDETANVQAPFHAAGIDVSRVFYFGESVLLRAYRGLGAGVRFFAEREAHARRVSACDIASFCAVQRPPDHPARPPDAAPLDAFWRRRGFTPAPGLSCEMRWREVGAAEETTHRLAFWMKSLTGAPLP